MTRPISITKIAEQSDLSEQDFEVREERWAGLVVHIVLDGSVEAWIDENRLELGRAGAPVSIAYSASRGPVPLIRRARRNEYLRAVDISVSWDWLAWRGVPVSAVLGETEFDQGQWPARPEEIACAERLITLAGAECPTAAGPIALEREVLALTLLARLLDRLSERAGGTLLSSSERSRLDRMEAFAQRDGPVPDVSAIAREGGMSVSSARRLFARAYGLPIVARIRELRMARAMAALQEGRAVSEAARIAGYLSSESFATAFKKRYGTSPSRNRKHAPARR